MYLYIYICTFQCIHVNVWHMSSVQNPSLLIQNKVFEHCSLLLFRGSPSDLPRLVESWIPMPSWSCQTSQGKVDAKSWQVPWDRCNSVRPERVRRKINNNKANQLRPEVFNFPWFCSIDQAPSIISINSQCFMTMQVEAQTPLQKAQHLVNKVLKDVNECRIHGIC